MHHTRTLTALLLSLASMSAAAALSPGQLDDGFGVNGTRIVGASLSGGSQRGPATVVEGLGGQLYVVGNVERADATVAVGIARLSADGAIDTDFGNNGLLEFTPDGVANAAAYGATVDAQKRVLVVGEAESLGRRAMVCRLTPDGDADETFGSPVTPGCMLLTVGQPAWLRDVIVQPCQTPDECVDGTRIVAAGTLVDAESIRRGFVAGIRADGSDVDTLFGDAGVAMVEHPKLDDLPVELSAIAQDQIGDLLAVGTVEFSASASEMLAMRLDNDGSLRSTFGSGGITSIGFNLFDNGGRTVGTGAYLSDEGWPMLVGHTEVDARRKKLALVRLTNAGDLDQTFTGSPDGDPGMLLYAPCGGVCAVRGQDMAVTPDGQIVVTGSIAIGDEDETNLSALNNTFVMRFDALGTPDPTFRSPGVAFDGLSIIDHGAVAGNSDDVGSTVLLQGERIVVAGYARAADPDVDDDRLDYYDFALARLGGGAPIFGDGFE